MRKDRPSTGGPSFLLYLIAKNVAIKENIFSTTMERTSRMGGVFFGASMAPSTRAGSFKPKTQPRQTRSFADNNEFLKTFRFLYVHECSMQKQSLAIIFFFYSPLLFLSHRMK
jgi:hypothetical protein